MPHTTPDTSPPAMGNFHSGFDFPSKQAFMQQTFAQLQRAAARAEKEKERAAAVAAKNRAAEKERDEQLGRAILAAHVKETASSDNSAMLRADSARAHRPPLPQPGPLGARLRPPRALSGPRPR